MKIIADQQILHVAQAFESIADVTLCHGREITKATLQDADALLVRSITPVNAELLENSSVKFVATATSGLDHIDTKYLEDKEIGFAHAKGSNARSVAEYVLSSLYVLAEQKGFELRDKTVGVVGCGEVGKQVIKMLDALGLQIIKNDPFLQDEALKQDKNDEQYRDLQEIFQADIITLHVPFTDDGLYPTKNLINADVLEQLRDDVILFNTSRGDVIDEADLKKHLGQHEAMSVVLDVWQQEPAIDLELLKQIDIGTPHIAGYSTDGKLRATEMIFRSFCDFFGIESVWPDNIELNNINRVELTISEEVNDADAIQMASLASYDVRSDAASLKGILGGVLEMQPQEQARYFDELRKNYPIRREFQHAEIHVDKKRTSLTEKLRAIGFTVKPLS